MAETLNASEVRTRRAIINRLKQEGPLDVASLSKFLGLTTMAVRLHLEKLTQEGLTAYRDEKRSMGRPARVWALTERADSLFPSSYEELALDLVSSIVTAFGANGLEKIIDVRTKQQTESYRTVVPSVGPLRKRLEALAHLRTTQGYMATVEEPSAGEYVLIENHCPICAVAKKCTGLCARELELFESTLGPSVHIERTEHLLTGDRRCTYRITEDRSIGLTGARENLESAEATKDDPLQEGSQEPLTSDVGRRSRAKRPNGFVKRSRSDKENRPATD